jgi:uncharacterized membrane protein YgcG
MGVNSPAFHFKSSFLRVFRSNPAQPCLAVRQAYPLQALFPSSSKNTILKILLLTISCLLLAINFVSAQSVSPQYIKISGKFISDSDKTPLPGVLVEVYTPDSAKQYVTSTDNNGNFVFNNLESSRYRLRATFLSYADFTIRLAESAKDINMGTLKMKFSSTALKGVTIHGEVPVRQNEDTTEYSADAFKTQPDATAEDLVNKMPGITSQNGAVTVNGEQVTQVLVDGAPFFGDDPMVALKNLPAEVIDKIQVFDKLSDQAQFTGFDDGNTQKTINIVTKRNRRNGTFGKAYGGYGTDQRYLAGGNMNFFNGVSRFSIIGLANNVNQQNFATEDILGMLGGSGNGGGGQGRGGSGGGPRSGGGGSFGGGGASNISSTGSGLSRGAGNYLVGTQGGITSTNSIGLNYTDAWNKNRIKLSSSYFFNNAVNSNTTNSTTSYTGGPEAGSVYDQNTGSGSTNYNSRINGRLEWNLDTNNAIYVVLKGSIQQTATSSALTESDFLEEMIQSFSNTNSSSSSRGYDYSGNILYMHKLKKRFRTISWNIGFDDNDKSTPGGLMAFDQYYVRDTTSTTITSTLINQQYSQPAMGYTLSSNLSYTEPIDSNSLIQLNYNPSVNINNTDKRTFNFDSTSEWYTLPDTALSNQYQNTYITNAIGLSYRLNHGKKYYIMVSVNPQYSTLIAQEEYPLSNLPAVQRNYVSVLPRVIFNYRFTQSKNLRLMYRSNVTPPSISQLQNVVNNSNPLLLNTGNPQLKQDFEQSFIARYGATNSAAATTFLVYMYANYIENYIGNASFIPLRDSILSDGTILYTGSQLSEPVNLQGYWNAKAFITYGWLIRPLKVNINLNTGFVYTRTPALINDIANYSSNDTYSGGLVLSSNISENVDYTLSYTGNYSTVTNTLQNTGDDNYYTGVATGKINVILFKGLILNTSLSQTSYSGLSAAQYNQAIYLWNGSIGYKFLKNKMLQVSISANDILNQNTSITRTVTDTYIQDSQTIVLRRYFMLNLQLNIRKYKVSSAPPADNTEGAGKS